MKKYSSGFTLVEVIVVTMILAVLGTIGFISYANYLIGVRDTKRLADLGAIHDGLQSSVTKGDLANPDDSIVINAGGVLVGNQGYAGAGILNLIGLQNGGGKDPKNDTYYTYYLYKDKKSFQLMAWFEDTPDRLKSTSLHMPFIPEAYAGTPDYSVRFPKVYGKQLGILTNSLKIPVQELQTGALDIGTTVNTYIAYLNDTTTVSGTGGVLVSTLPNATCKRIRDNGNGSGDGLYRIDPVGNGGYDVWCDMSTDGGGWTMSVMLADSTTQNLFYTANTDKIIDLKTNIATRGRLSDIWRDTASKDIMIKCTSEKPNISATYSTPYIMYNFLKNDLPNLEKQVKNNTILALYPLTAKYNGNTFTVHTSYGNSGGNTQSTYFVDRSLSKSNFGIWNGNQLQVASDTGWVATNGPLYNSNTSSDLATFSTTTYCVTAIR